MAHPLLTLALKKPEAIPKVEANANQLENIFGAVLIVAGIAAVVLIIVSSIMYVISMGDAAKIKKAKDGIMYAVVGLVVIALSFMIVQLVVGIF